MILVLSLMLIFTTMTLGKPRGEETLPKGPPESSSAVLVVGGGRPPPPLDSPSLFRHYPWYRQAAARLQCAPLRTVGPAGLLYLQEREMAVATRGDENVLIIGTDDATTCIIGILRHSGSGAVGVAHFDDQGADDAVDVLVRRLRALSTTQHTGRYQLTLIGGIPDQWNSTDTIFGQLMQAFHRQTIEVDLVQAMVGQLNSQVKGDITWPIFYGAGVIVSSGEIFPGVFPDKGPAYVLRLARVLTGPGQLMDVYDMDKGLLEIGPFSYDQVENATMFLKMSDKDLLEYMSTTPLVERPYFAQDTRDAIKFIMENPDPEKTIFKEKKPLYFKRDKHSGTWTALESC